MGSNFVLPELYRNILITLVSYQTFLAPEYTLPDKRLVFNFFNPKKSICVFIFYFFIISSLQTEGLQLLCNLKSQNKQTKHEKNMKQHEKAWKTKKQHEKHKKTQQKTRNTWKKHDKHEKHENWFLYRNRVNVIGS